MRLVHCIIATLLVSLHYTTPATGQNVYSCDNCSRFIEIDKLQARCFKKRFEKQGLLDQFTDETVQGISVNFKCSLKSRDVVSSKRKTENDPNTHTLTKDAIECLYRIVVEQADTFSSSRLISFEKHCSDG